MLLDFKMPKLNGIQVVEKIRNFINKSNSSVIGLKIHIEEPEYVFLTAFAT